MIVTSKPKLKKKSRKFCNSEQKTHKQVCRWLRERISPYDIGIKTEDGPRHCNPNVKIMSLFNRLRGGLSRIYLDRLNNADYLDHFEGRKTYYFTADGRGRCREVLVNIDIDCHRSGSLAGAIAFAEHLRDTDFPRLYFEASTNGRGVHGYFVFRKGDLGAEGLNSLLKRLDRKLKGSLAQGDWDVEGVEVKGHAPVFHWGDAKFELRAYQSGQLAKLPREALHRADELMGTTRFNFYQMSRLVSTIPDMVPEKPTVKRTTSPSLGSISGLSIPTDLAEQVQDRLLGIARDMFPAGMRTANDREVLAEDMAVLLAILIFCADNPNADGSMPTKRIKSLWEVLRVHGHTDQFWDHNKYKVLRDWLSQNHWLAWKDEGFVAGKMNNGVFQKGRAARWAANERLLALLKEDNDEKGLDVVGGLAQGEEKESDIFTYEANGENTGTSLSTLDSSGGMERRETSLCTDQQSTLPFELLGWQNTWRSPRFIGYVGEPRQLAA